MTTVNDVTAIDARRPVRVVIREMVPGTRGPGDVLARIYDAKNVGGSELHNSTGEFHMTLPNDHIALPFIKPRKVHYRVDQKNADATWREVFAGLVMDVQASDDETIILGIDYLGLFSVIIDERGVIEDQVDEPVPVGSKYVNVDIGFIVADQLQRAVSLVDSPVGFIEVGPIAAMPEKIAALWGIMRPTLEFCRDLIDSHRQGTGKMSQIRVFNDAGTYTVTVEDDPGDNLPNLRLGYGELVSGYQAVPFGPNWASLVHGIGRRREGTKLDYSTQSPTTITTAEWGRFAQAHLWLDIDDENDLKRRTKQLAWENSRLGQKLGLGLKANALRPKDGYHLLDNVPVEIIHGEVDTRDYADWWCIVGLTFETFTDGHTDLTLTITPRTPVELADPDLANAKPYPPFGGDFVGPDGINPRGDDSHVHAIGEPHIGNAVTVVFYTANEFEPDTIEADVNGVQVDVTESPTHDYVTFAVAPSLEGEVRFDYLAVLGPLV
jgi:hypothetical protein